MKQTFIILPLLLTTALAQTWDGEYLPAQAGYPDQTTPPWKARVESSGAEVKVRDDVLAIDTGSVIDGRVTFEQAAGWNGEPGSEVEVEVRVVTPLDGNLPSAAILISGPEGWQSLAIGHNAIGLSGRQPKYSLDLSEFQTLNLRITQEGMVEVRVKRQPEPILTVPLKPHADTASINLSFGDLSTTPNIGGLVEWKSVRWKQGTQK